MSTLSDTLRSKLENTVIKAREQAEKGARAALEGLEVHLGATTRDLNPDERELRRRLRAHGRQIGDVLEPVAANQGITHLTWECAYQHWHRMLFARFLAENQVLIHPELKVVVTLEECADLAKEEGLPDGWAVAARYASRMLPQIFRQDHPVLQLRLPAEFQRSLENLLAALPSEIFHARDSLGWVYQFWQTKRKEEINKSEAKIGADELPAVTQLFTEPYMVDFLLQNSLGAWWVGAGRPLPEGLELPYLRLLDDGSPAAGKFEGWPSRAAELKVLDPCCGSGHFLVAAFDLLTRFRMAEEGLSAREAGDAVLRDNLFGLELDERCTQIAAFAVALAAWTFPGAGGFRDLRPHTACIGHSITSHESEWVSLVGSSEREQRGMLQIYSLCRDAGTIGTLINPAEIGIERGQYSLEVASFEELRSAIINFLRRSHQDDLFELGVVAQGLAEALEYLRFKYHLVATNVPYLAWGKQGARLQEYVTARYSSAKWDLATVFLSRIMLFTGQSGCTAIVMPMSWLYQDYYRKFRNTLLKKYRLKFLSTLGAGAFQTITGEVVKALLLIVSNEHPMAGSTAKGIDCADISSVTDKMRQLLDSPLLTIRQDEQLNNPDSRILLTANDASTLLSEYVDYQQGICTGDYSQFGRCFWEMSGDADGWRYQQSTVNSTRYFGGSEHLLWWENGSGALYQFIVERLGENRVGSWLRGGSAWGKTGIAISSTGQISASLYLGTLYDDSTMVLTPKDPQDLGAVWEFCCSESYGTAVRRLDQKLNVRSALIKVPFDLAHWQQVAAERYPNGLPKPYSDDPTQWLFHGHPRPSTAPLQVAIGRLLGYTWPAETDDKMELSDEARAWIARTQSLKAHVDQDGIVCLPSVRGEAPAAERLQALLADAFGEEWSANLLEGLLKDVQCAGWNLDRWLRDKFFEQHCAFFHHRPFIWHIWDGRKDGFSALVNYHTLDHKRLETLVYDYLGDWIRRQQDELNQSVDGARERLDAAVWLKGRLEAILEGEAPFDIFVRWKPLEKQPIGWEPDINDGVRLNIRPFVQAGVLRKEPKIKWDKDRGKDPAGSPWGEERFNDRHLTLAEKRMARGKGK